MDGNVLVLCDTEEEYAQHMSAYLKEQREVMWEIHTYTDVKEAKDGYKILTGDDNFE